VFGWAVAFEKVFVGCGLWKSSCEKAAVGKAEDCLVRGAAKLQSVREVPVMPQNVWDMFICKLLVKNLIYSLFFI
jgi:hypothetical protein